MKRLLPPIILVVISMVIGCEQHHPVEVARVPNYEAIRAQLEIEQNAYAQAWNKKDMNAIGEIWAHDPDITIWGPAERDRVKGWEGPNGVKAWYESAMAGMSKVDFKINDLLIKVSTDGTAAVVTYYVDNDFVDLNGNPGKMTPRVTVVKELRDGKWKQIHGDASYSISEVDAMQ